MTILTWETADDWNANQSESGVAHESVANTDHDDATVVKKGYSYSAPYKSSSLVGFWPLHEDSGTTAYDISGTGAHGTYQGSPALGATGLLNNDAPSSDGSGEYVDIPSGYSAIQQEQNFTLFFAFYYRTSTSSEYFFDDPGHDWWLKNNDGTRDLQFNDGGTPASVNNLNTGQWYIGGAVHDGSDRHLYVYNPDGTLFGSDTVTNTGTTGNSNQSGAIYEYRGGGYNPDGKPTEYRLYNTGFTQSEVEELVNVVTAAGTFTTSAKTS